MKDEDIRKIRDHIDLRSKVLLRAVTSFGFLVVFIILAEGGNVFASLFALVPTLYFTFRLKNTARDHEYEKLKRRVEEGEEQ